MDKLSSIQALRGIAALSVCVFHFLSANTAAGAPQIIQDITAYGGHGVTVFFVISGFVLPLSLFRSDYTPRSFPRFVLRRLIRLEPPYLVTIALAMSLGVAASYAPGFHGQTPNYDAVTIISHIGYLTPVIGKEWIVPVFWTLLVEFQFYLLIGILFPFLMRYPVMTIVIASAAGVIPSSPNFLGAHIPIFMIGATTFLWHAKQIKDRQAVVLLFALGLYTCAITGLAAAIAALFAASVITFTTVRNPILLSLGSVSYSLYLLHIPIGSRAVNLISRWTDIWPITFAAAIAVSIVTAWLMYRFVELPSMRLSARYRIALIKRSGQIGVSPPLSSGLPNS